MAAINPCLTRSTDLCGELLVRLGVPVLDDYLQFAAARARPNGAIFARVKVAVDRAGAKGLKKVTGSDPDSKPRCLRHTPDMATLTTRSRPVTEPLAT
ncbi:MAG: hypothetical protein QOH09_2359 [Pseudonocardiales bacterium]|jgi:hypothetical protein|nr:hypothetical protein [Pseudonocardiales bacterium]